MQYIVTKLEADGSHIILGGPYNDEEQARADANAAGGYVKRLAEPDEVIVEERALDTAHGLLQYEVERQEMDPDYDPHADTDVWRRTRDVIGDALDD